MRTRLSVNVNKIALIRNARGGNNPNLYQFAKDCERFGAEGITVHPRPDERHIRFDDLAPLKNVCKTEFNIEGNPTPDFIEHVLKHKPHQVTLVPDDPNQLTSDHGWDCLKHHAFLKQTIQLFHQHNIRVSIFLDPEVDMVEAAKLTGTDRIELYTGPYAHQFHDNKEESIKPYIATALEAQRQGLGINAGHDLDLFNLAYFAQSIPNLLEVSIGHALVTDALYLGLQKTIEAYLDRLAPSYPA